MDKDNCDWTWGSANGQNGYYVTSRINGNSIFLPDRDSRIQPLYLPTSFYWSSSLYVENPSCAFSFNFSNDSKHIAASYVRCSDERRYYNFLIRPVYGDYAAEIPVTGVSLNTTSIELVEGESLTLVATVEPANATNKTVIWTSSDSSIASVDDNGNVTGIEAGETSIIATAGDKTAACKVVVNKVVSQDVITFADSNIKAALVAAFDTNGDGELSLDEAAAVTSIEGVFGDYKLYTSFDEFEYFTNVTKIPSGCFGDWSRLSSIKIPNSITEIGEGAFAYCMVLKSLVLPDSITTIGRSAFLSCANLVSINIPTRINKINAGVFIGLGIKDITIPESVEVIDSEAFRDCEKLLTINIPDNVKYIGDGAFRSCFSLVEVSLPQGLQEIANELFAGCQNLNSIVIPPKVRTIGRLAFEYCPIKSIIIPDSVTDMEFGAFESCHSLEDVVLSLNLTSLPQSCFQYCEHISSIQIPSKITTLGPGAFFGCTSLSNVEFQGETISLNNQCFAYCTSLIKMSLPKTVNSIGQKVFWGCEKLSSLVIPSINVPKGNSQMFEITGGLVIYVPSESLELYKAAEYWSDYADRIQAIPGTETHSYVDLGLSVKWATYNVGVSSPQEQDYGGYYAWGETEVKTNYSGWGSYKWCNGSEMNLTKYCSADGKTVLELEDDAAHVNFGHNWRIPTNEEWTELIEKCTWTWTNNYIGTGVKGMIVEGSNGNSIFLPAAGGQGMPHSDGEAEYAGDYWSSSLNTMEPDRAYYVYFDSSGVRSYSAGIRCFGFSVRPVSE